MSHFGSTVEASCHPLSWSLKLGTVARLQVVCRAVATIASQIGHRELVLDFGITSNGQNTSDGFANLGIFVHLLFWKQVVKIDLVLHGKT